MISLPFQGYWREPNVSGIPPQSGVYTVYACRHLVAEGTVSIRKLVYIGESANVRARILSHECWPRWRRHLQPGEEVCVSFAPIFADRERAEAAAINHHRPPENVEFVHEFPYPQTTVSTSGRNVLLSPYFTVYSTMRSAFAR